MGDTHKLDGITKLIKQHDMKNFVLIGCGDHGEGFGAKTGQEHEVKRINRECEERNGEVFLVRGNHTDPSWYTEIKFPQFPKVNFVPDYSLLDFEGKKFLFVGGAISIDRVHRIIQENYYGKKIWWKDEVFVLNENAAQKCDFLITHSSGISEFPQWGKAGIKNWLDSDNELEKDCDAERSDIQKLVDLSSPKYHFFGHFHTSVSEYLGEPKYLSRCLAIDEILEITDYLKNDN